MFNYCPTTQLGSRPGRRLNHPILFIAALFGVISTAHADSVSTFSTGFNVPETISIAPATFGAYSGEFIVSDAASNSASNTGGVYAVPITGGSPTLISSISSVGFVGGTFAPTSYGSLSGSYIAAGELNGPNNSTNAALYSIASSGSPTLLYQDTSGNNEQADGPIVAPAGFGSAGGKVLFSFFTIDASQMMILNSDGSTSPFGPSLPTNFGTFGTAFAPAGFGSVGGMLLVSDTDSGEILAIDSQGNEHPFADLSLNANQTGLREIAFAPAGFGQYGGDLFVSISGSQNGGGVAGEVVVLDQNGNIIAVLEQGVDGASFDPRGLYFLNDSELLISDSDPSILLAPSTAFTATPEPAAMLLSSMGLGILGIFSCRRDKLITTS